MSSVPASAGSAHSLNLIRLPLHPILAKMQCHYCFFVGEIQQTYKTRKYDVVPLLILILMNVRLLSDTLSSDCWIFNEHKQQRLVLQSECLSVIVSFLFLIVGFQQWNVLMYSHNGSLSKTVSGFTTETITS